MTAKNEASFAVKLIDKVTRPSRGIVAAIARIQKAAKRSMMGDSRSGRFSDKQGRLREKDGRFVKTKFGDAFKKANVSLDRFVKGLGVATIKGGALAGVLASIGAGFVVKGIAEATAFVERSSMAFTNLTGSATKGAEAFRKAIGLSRELGLDVQDTTKQYQKLLAAQFSAGQAETLIKLTTDLKAIGATAEETHSAIRAITQIKAKGRLQAEELVGQLAEAGVATTLVYEELAKSLNVDVKKVPGIITAGAVDADTGIAAIQKAILKKVNIKQAGDAGKRFANATLAGMFERLKNAPGQLFVRIAQAGERALPKLKGAVEQIEKMIDGIDPAAVAVAFERIIDLARTGITLGAEFAGGFAQGFGEISAALQPGSIGNAAMQFRELGRNVAKLTVYAIEAAKVAGSLFSWLASGPGRATLAITGLVLGFGKLLAIVGAVGTAFGATAGTGLLASMGSFGVGAALFGKAGGAILGLLVALKGAAVAAGGAIAAAFATAVAPVLAVVGAFSAAYFGMKKILDLAGFTSKLESVGASFAGPAVPRAAQRGVGQIATEGPGYPYAAARPATSALVKRNQIGPGPAAAAAAQGGTVTFGNLTLQIGTPPASASRSPREWGREAAEGFKNGLGNMTGATAGG